MILRRAWLLTAGSALAFSTAGWAQVSVPLPSPNRPTAPVPAPVPPARQQPGTSVPLPTGGSTGGSSSPPPQQQPGVSVPLPGAPTAPALPAIPIGKYGRPDINPYDRDVNLTVPLTFRDRPLGEVPVVLTHDDRLVIETPPFLKLIDPLLNPAAREKLAKMLGAHATFTAEDLSASGVSLVYDPGTLSVVVLQIAPEERAMESLFQTPRPDDEPPDVQPAFFSAYLNANVIGSKFWGIGSRISRPSFYVNGAARVGPVVFEGDVQYTEEAASITGYRFDRSYARFVYDEPEKLRRWFAGDLVPEIRGQQGFVQLGGLGVSRQRQRFDQFRSAILQGNRQIVLQRNSTVDVFRNGSLLKQFRLDAGSYDLSSLPLLSGSNDLQVEVRDDAGGIQRLSYNSYLDPINLQPGDYEYGAYIGKTGDRFSRTPVYNSDYAFTGFYRKAFLDRPAIGVGVQASRRVQVLTGQTQYILPNGGRVQFDLGVSNVRDFGFGYSGGVSYDQIFDRAGLIDSFTLRADHLSRRFGSLGFTTPDNTSAWNFNAQYARAFTFDITLLLGANYLKGRGALGDSYRLDASTAYRLTRTWSVRGGVDYSRFGGSFARRNGIGFNVSLVFQPNYRDRAEARYDHSTRNQTASYTHAGTGQIGSIGYGVIAGRDLGSTNAQAFADYTANRFDASLSHGVFGTGFGNITDQQVTTVRVGTSLAYADGHFGIGRRINDSFALLYPHRTLGGRSVVAGQSLAENNYLSRSGTFGAAVNGYLTSYVTQSVQYDVDNPPTGYDVGAGVVRVRPPYRSGYALVVGTEAFVSATGTLQQADGKPVALAGGRVVALDGKDKTPLPFFTNSIGRFAIANLRPSVSYHVEVFGGNSTFDFTVPKDTDGLVDLRTVKLTPKP